MRTTNAINGADELENIRDLHISQKAMEGEAIIEGLENRAAIETDPEKKARLYAILNRMICS
jgi:hypothetical protein